MKSFIKTSDKKTIEYLRNHGFKEIVGANKDVVTFVNDMGKSITSFADAKFVYSDKIEL